MPYNPDMGVFKSLGLLIISFVIVALFNFGFLGTRAAAEVTPQDVQNSLCNGADVKISDQPCSNTDSQGLDTLAKVATRVINTLSLIVGIVAVVMIMVGGLRYVTSGGSDTSVTSAKNTILYAIIGLIVVALSQVLVHFILRQLS
jgi:predicted permease